MDGMTDDDETPLERDLRRVLSDPGYRLPDRLVPLERVHAGAVRRRRRNQAVTASLAAVALVGLGLGVAHPWTSGGGTAPIAASNGATSSTPSSPSSSKPSSSPNSSSAAVSASIIGPGPLTSAMQQAILSHVQSAMSVTAIDDSHWWVAASISDCDCTSVVLSTSNDGKTFSVVDAFSSPGIGNDVESMRYLDNGHASVLSTDKAGSDGVLQDSDDGGKTWQAETGSATSFVALEAGGGKTRWALQLNADSHIHVWRRLVSGSWADIATLPDSPTIGADNVQLTVQVDRAVVVWRGATSIESASFDSSGAISGPTAVPGCSADIGLGTLSGGRGAVWLTCPVGTSDLVFRSTDDGHSWSKVPVSGDAGRHVVGAIDATHAAISTATGLAVVGSDGTLKAAQLPSGVATSGWTYIGFTGSTHGFAVTDTGQLLRSTDGGLTWNIVKFTG
jgi:hypothetical protein